MGFPPLIDNRLATEVPEPRDSSMPVIAGDNSAREFSGLCRERTIKVAALRLSSLQACDYIVIDGGRVTAVAPFGWFIEDTQRVSRICGTDLS